jgi:hypothetical protein
MAYAVEWEDLAKTSADLLTKSAPFFDLALVGLEWGLSRKPFLCKKLSGTSLRCMTLGPFIPADKIPIAVKVFFRIVDESTVKVCWLEARSRED